MLAWLAFCTPEQQQRNRANHGRLSYASPVSRNDIILGLVALVLVVFSLTVAIVVPRRNPGFPGKSLRPFLLVAIALVGGTLATVEILGGEEGEGAEAAEVTEAAPPSGEPAPPPAAEPTGDAAAGKELFAANGCGSCHTLADAGASGTIGPNLDESKPAFDLVVERVTNGKPPMPAFGGTLSAEQIENVAAYVVQATSGS